MTVRRIAGIAGRAALALLVLLAAPASGPAAGGEAPRFERGINLSHLFIFPRESGWPPFRGPKAVVTNDELARLRALGLDFIRLPVDPTPFINASAAQRRDLTARIQLFIRRASGAGLSVLVTGYTTDGDLAWRPGRDTSEGAQTFEQYAAWLEDLAAAVADAAPGNAAIQLMNEPQTDCGEQSEEVWAGYQARLHARIRARVDLPIVLNGGCWSHIGGLIRLTDLPDDPNTLFDVHHYDPFAFTHQSATWTTPVLAYVGGLRFPPGRTVRAEAAAIVDALIASRHDGSAAEVEDLRAQAMAVVDDYRSSRQGPAAIAAEFAGLAAWARARGIAPARILVGEFGAINDAVAAHGPSRERYLALIRSTAEIHGFGWAMWGYYPSFGILEDDITRTPSMAVARALGLSLDAARAGRGSERIGRTRQ